MACAPPAAPSLPPGPVSGSRRSPSIQSRPRRSATRTSCSAHVASSGLPISFTAERRLHGHGDHGAPDEGGCVLDHCLHSQATRSYNPRADASRELPDRRRSRAQGARPPTSGRRGASVKLPFRVGSGNGEVAGQGTIQRNGTVVSRLTRGLLQSRRRDMHMGCRGGRRRRRRTPTTASASRSPTTRAGRPRPAVVASD
jgi:hypothetical protein